MRRIALRALGAAGGPQGQGVRVHRPRRTDENISRRCANCETGRLRGGVIEWRGRVLRRAAARSGKDYVRAFADSKWTSKPSAAGVLPDCPSPISRWSIRWAARAAEDRPCRQAWVRTRGTIVLSAR